MVRQHCSRLPAPRSAAAAVPPVNDKDFADFSLIKINGGDNSLAKIQKKGCCRRHLERLALFVPGSERPTNGPAWMPISSAYVVKMLKIDKITVQTVTFDG